MGPFPIPTINTALLLTSGVTLTISHHALRVGDRSKTAIWLAATILLGAIMLSVVLYRVMKGHFTADHHFAFEGAAWYWHFVDVVWLGLYVVVYWL
jgi:cytochrome c oxidase subunit 3